MSYKECFKTVHFAGGKRMNWNRIKLVKRFIKNIFLVRSSLKIRDNKWENHLIITYSSGDIYLQNELYLTLNDIKKMKDDILKYNFKVKK